MAAVVEAGRRTRCREEGEGFRVDAENGAVVLPDEADDPTTRAPARRRAALRAEVQPRPGRERIARGAAAGRSRSASPACASTCASSPSSPSRSAIGWVSTGKALEQLRLAAELHDVGKLAIPVAVLAEAGRADRAGVAVRPPAHRRRPADPLGIARPCARSRGIVRATHERWDGAGYVDGLSGAAIPLAARIIAVCDAYAAMTSDRPYRRALQRVRRARRASSLRRHAVRSRGRLRVLPAARRHRPDERAARPCRGIGARAPTAEGTPN